MSIVVLELVLGRLLQWLYAFHLACLSVPSGVWVFSLVFTLLFLPLINQANLLLKQTLAWGTHACLLVQTF